MRENVALDNVESADPVEEMLENMIEEDPHLDDNMNENGTDPQSIEEVEIDISSPSRRSERQRKASKLAEGMIVYNPRRKMPRIEPDDDLANLARIENRFAYRKFIPKCFEHMTRILITLATNDDKMNFDNQKYSNESASLKNAMRRSDWSEWEAAMRREHDSLVKNKTWNLINRIETSNVITER